MPKISVIMPVYNGEKYLREAIDSVLNQTFSDFEFIILNDASKDSTEEIIKSYKDDRIVYIKNEQNLGVAGTLNRGLGIAKGEYIARMDADDISLPERFQKQVNFMDKHKNTNVLGTSITIFGEEIQNSVRHFLSDPNKAKVELIFAPCTAHPTIFIRRNMLINNHIYYKKEYEGIEDYALLWDMSHLGDISSLEDNLFYYRCHKTQVTKTYTSKAKERFFDFLSYRMKNMGIELNEREKEIFMNYCNGQCLQFEYEHICVLIEIMKKINKANNDISFFDVDCLHNKFMITIYECLYSINLKKKEIRTVIKSVLLCKWLKHFYKLKFLVIYFINKGGLR